MSLSAEEKRRLADIVQLQPTKNSELQERWGLDSGSEVHQYLETHLGDYYYRDDDSYIRATDEAADLVDVEPGVESGTGQGGVPEVIRVPELQAQVFRVVAGPDERAESVVSVLHKLRDAFDVDPEAEEVRRALRSLKRKSVVDIEYRTVPTFRLAVERDAVTVEAVDDSESGDDADTASDDHSASGEADAAASDDHSASGEADAAASGEGGDGDVLDALEEEFDGLDAAE